MGGGLGVSSCRYIYIFFDALRLILRHSGDTCSQFLKKNLHSQTQFYLGLIKIEIESSEKLTDSNLEEIVDLWHRKGRRIAV